MMSTIEQESAGMGGFARLKFLMTLNIGYYSGTPM